MTEYGEVCHTMLSIFILLSIKTRIETIDNCGFFALCYGFLSYYPLKQGLKRSIHELADKLL